ncbi:pitrilysin family protein [soil metagenome]
MKRFLLLVVLAWTVPVHAALQIQSWTLANGARVLFVENHSIPMLDISVAFDAGSRRDPKGKTGTAALTNAMLTSGLRASDTPKEPAMSEAQISDAFADTAAQRGDGVDNDRARVTLRTLSSKAERDASAALVARLLAQPSFPADILARDKARTIAAIKEDLTKPESIGDRAFSRLLYGEHPYAKEETVESIEAITRDDLLAFHRTHFVANRALIAMIGDITRVEADTLAQQLTQRLPQGTALPVLPEVPPAVGKEERIAHPASQSHILIGQPAAARGDPDYFALMVGNYVLGGGGFVSRLTNEVREKRGLVYSIASQFTPVAQKGPFEISLQTQKSQTDEALKLVREILAAFLRDGPTPAELKAAKDNLIGGFPLRIDNNKKILENLAVIGFYNLPLDYLETWTANVDKVTAAQIKAAFNRKVALDQLTTVVVGEVKPKAP